MTLTLDSSLSVRTPCPHLWSREKSRAHCVLSWPMRCCWSKWMTTCVPQSQVSLSSTHVPQTQASSEKRVLRLTHPVASAGSRLDGTSARTCPHWAGRAAGRKGRQQVRSPAIASSAGGRLGQQQWWWCWGLQLLHLPPGPGTLPFIWGNLSDKFVYRISSAFIGEPANLEIA